MPLTAFYSTTSRLDAVSSPSLGGNADVQASLTLSAGTTFVTRKITTQVALIATGQSEFFELGNLNSTRDWGHSKDYMRGAHLMLQQPEGGDYVLATGSSHSVRDFVNAAFDVVGMKIE